MIEHFQSLMTLHINLIERRILREEIIPHEEKMFSVFETYTSSNIKDFTITEQREISNNCV